MALPFDVMPLASVLDCSCAEVGAELYVGVGAVVEYVESGTRATDPVWFGDSNAPRVLYINSVSRKVFLNEVKKN